MLPPVSYRTQRLLTLALIVLGFSSAARALEPDEIALVVNAKVPASRQLAELYVRERHLPEGRIIEIAHEPGNPASPAEELSAVQYETEVAQPIRDFLLKNTLEKKVKCLVTFWGVPLRIARRTNDAAANDELTTINREMAATRLAADERVSALEKLAGELTPGYQPLTRLNDFDTLQKRFESAASVALKGLAAIKDSKERDPKVFRFVLLVEKLKGAAGTLQLLSRPELAKIIMRPVTPEQATAAQDKLARQQKEVEETLGYSPNAEAREKVRQLAHKNFGIFGYGTILQLQINGFDATESEAALDSELAMLWWRAYPRAHWVENPLYYKAAAAAALQKSHKGALTLMVMRLDGPSEEIVRQIITTSVRVEQEGIKGMIALDTWNKPVGTEYGKYDETIRNLDRLLTTSDSKVKVTLESTDALFPANSLKDIAVYCGWYSVRNYVKPGNFSPGAVGFHIASFELVSLRQPGEKGWVRGLLNDGVVATLGPVAEPYLHSFPKADEFFPLLFTGKLTLAEVYWRTNPLASWMNAFIGDPLYTPYKVKPALAVEDLPEDLRTVFALDLPQGAPTTQAAP